jgi:2-polyprenyl-3-methyl-5-hydroxy-6-metoxy-1,4-benzoquinol methylase
MEFIRIADKKRVDFITHAIKNMVPPGASILDIGCGNGIITRAVGAMDYSVTGIDVSPGTIANAISSNTLPNVNFMVAGVDDLKPQPGKFAAIICSEVLEHLHHPSSLLDIIHKSLKDDGVLIVTVPNGIGPRELFVTRPVQYFQKKNNIAWRLLSSFKKLLGYRGVTVQSAADDLTHLQFFTPKTFRLLAASAGFRIEIIKKTNFIEQVFPFSLMAKRSLLLQKLDCMAADRLPLRFTSGFMSIWKKV